MAQRKISSAARITIETDGTAKLINTPVDGDELAALSSLAEEYGWQAIADAEGFEHIRLNDPEGQGFHRDYAVRWS